MAGPLGRLVLLLSFLSTFLFCVLGKPATGNIDDGETTFKPGYEVAFLPAKNGHWNDAAACTASSPFCLPAEASRAFGQTWTSTALYQTQETRTVIINFIGDGISIFFTLVEGGPQNLSTICSFVLDEGPAEQYRHITNEGDGLSFTYQANTFSRTGLEHGQHKLTISIPPSTQGGSYLNFDYAQYSYDDELNLQPSTAAVVSPTTTVFIYPSGSSGSSRGSGSGASTRLPNEGVFKAAIIGGSVSGTVVVVALVLFLIYRARYRKRQVSGDRVTFGVPSTYAGSTRKLSLPFWPHKPAGNDSPSNFQNLTPLPQKRRSTSSYPADPYQEKYGPEYLPSPTESNAQLHHREEPAKTRERGSILSPAKALIEAFYTSQSRRGSATTGKLSRLEDSMTPASNFPRQLSRFSDIRGGQDITTASGTVSSSNDGLSLQTLPPSALRQGCV